MNYLDEIRGICESLNIFEVPLHEKCPHATECWKGGENRYPDGRWAYISAPYVGEKYDDSKILFLGKNLNEWGGFDAIDVCIKKERKRINRNKTNIYLWAAILAQLPLNLLGHISKNSMETDFRSISQNTINQMLDYIAFDNIIKCSPVGHRSEVVNDCMWDNCISLILTDIIEVLKPRLIFCLSKSGLYYLMENTYFKYYMLKYEDKHINIYSHSETNQILIATYHPAYRLFDKYVPEIISDIQQIGQSWSGST